jgi:6-phosphogluconate dehydrogenase
MTDALNVQVSGGYQAARRGPSLSPGGDEQTIKELMPLLEAFAVKDEDSGRPCVTFIGPGGAGHYVKMVHNGIEQGMMGAMAESWELMFKCLHMKLEDIAGVYESWSGQANSELVCALMVLSRQFTDQAAEEDLPRRDRRRCLQAARPI